MSILGVRPVMAACAPAAAVVDQAAPCSQSALTRGQAPMRTSAPLLRA